MDKPAQRYLKRLSRGLICSREDRERLLRDVGAMLENFSQENPGAFYGDYAASFGPPEEFAAQMLLSLDPEDVSEARLRRKRALMGTVAAAAVLVVLALGFWFGQRSRTPAEVPTPSAESVPPVLTPEPAPEETVEADAREAEAEAAAAAYLEGLYTDGDRITYKRAVAAMVQLGVVAGGEEFLPEGLVSRALCAKYMASMINGGKDFYRGEQEPPPAFPDTEGHWANDYIAYCKELNIVKGGADGCFDPDEPINGIEFANMALVALGYDPVAYQLVGADWAVNTNMEATMSCSPSLYEGLKRGSVTGDPINREEAAQILFNMLENPIITKIPDVSVNTGEVTFEYTRKTDDDGKYITFRSIHFPHAELGETAGPEN